MSIISLLPQGSLRHCPCCPCTRRPRFLCCPHCRCSLPLQLPSTGASCLLQLPVRQQHASRPQTQDRLQPLTHQQSRCCHLWLFTSSWLTFTLSHWYQHPPLIVAAAIIIAIASWLLAAWPCLRRNPYRRKKQKKSILIAAQKLKTAFQTGTFNESESGAIAHKNKKTIMAVTQWDLPPQWADSVECCKGLPIFRRTWWILPEKSRSDVVLCIFIRYCILFSSIFWYKYTNTQMSSPAWNSHIFQLWSTVS